ncbi:hypothetical protein NM208_g10393 [Fusarium decemcellulare]|uniref:Uncharacterized protein n=1 Tax=Fusarium decemcellulare TaxID=57161 RepID=A0ACC1RY20_9HYPO|nr:hypothetical protein NM208_g10393 [Fusarium decemcellulare]
MRHDATPLPAFSGCGRVVPDFRVSDRIFCRVWTTIRFRGFISEDEFRVLTLPPEPGVANTNQQPFSSLSAEKCLSSRPNQEAITLARSQLPPSFPIIWQDSVLWDQARVGRVFNHRRPSRQPLAVVEATREDHIVEAVRLARTLGARVSVRSGGHSWAAWSVREGAILIDLGKYHDFVLDESTGVAQVSPSMTGRMVNKLLGQRGRMFPGGHCPEVALGGFLLQGGMGWNCKVNHLMSNIQYLTSTNTLDFKNWGFACEKLLAIDVVTADGEKKHCDRNVNSDLYWAARGAGPGFPAVVTRFHLQTIPAFTHMRSSIYIYEKQDYEKAFSWILGITSEFDESTEIVAVGNHIQGRDGIHITILFVTFKNSEEEAQAALQPAQDSAPPGHVVSWFCKPTSLAEQYDDQHAANPDGHRYAVDNCYVKNDADVVSVLKESFTTLPTKKAFSLWYSMAPGSRRSVENGTMEDMALSMQTDHYFATYVIWEDKAEDVKCQSWVAQIMDQVKLESEGAYLGDSDFQKRLTSFWGQEQGKRLMDIRKKWDPQGTVAGYLDEGDKSGVNGLENVDLLKRHATCHDSNESGSKRQKRASALAPRVSQACKACAAAKLKCDEEASCNRCVSKGIPCDREARTIIVGDKRSTQAGSETTDEQIQPLSMFEQPNHLPFLEHDFSSFLRGVMTPTHGDPGRSIEQIDWTSIDPAYDPLQSHGLLDFRADSDMRFDDVAMGLGDLPCSPSFYYNGILLEPKSSAPVPKEPQKLDSDGRPLALGHAAYKESALGMWEPTQRDHINSNTKALSVLGESPHDPIILSGLDENPSQHFNPLHSSLRDQMLLLTLNACKPESKLAIIRAFPTPEILSKLIQSFFTHHRTQPDSFIHGPSFEPNEQGPEFILALVNIGTTFADSKVLHSLGFSLHEVVRVSLPKMFEQANSLTRNLGALQAFVLDIEMGLWSGLKRKMEIAESQRQMPYTMLRRSGRFGKAYQPASPPQPEDMGDTLQKKWLAWIEQESFSRLVYHSFIMDTQVSIGMSTQPLISFSEFKTPMPESKDLWLAPNAEAWKALYLKKERPENRLSLLEYFRDSAEIDDTYDVPFCRLIILCGIWGMVWQGLQTHAILGKPKHTDAVSNLRHQEILKALKCFILHMPEEETHTQDASATLLYELVQMHLHMPFEEVELFAGKGDQNDARRALPLLLDWASSEEARKAIWHGGQVLRAAEQFAPAQIRAFYTIALYQANLALWAYAVVSQVNGAENEQSLPPKGTAVCLNGPDSPAVQSPSR